MMEKTERITYSSVRTKPETAPTRSDNSFERVLPPVEV